MLVRKKEALAEVVLKETGGLGVDCVLETCSGDESPEFTKHDIVTVLAAGGRWVTTQQNLQLDPPHSHLLFLKGATMSFLFPSVWLLSSSQIGRYRRERPLPFCKSTAG